MSIRDDIVTMLGTVPGIKAYAYKPQSARVGDAWVTWGAEDRIAPGEFETSWKVVILAPLDERRQEAWREELRDQLMDALSPVVWVTRLYPGQSGDSPALMLDCKE